MEGTLEEAKEQEEKEETENEANEEYGDYSATLMAANLLEDEKHEEETHGEEGHEIETCGGLVLLEKSKEKGEEGIFPAFEMGDYLRDLEVEGIEVPVEEPSEKVEKLENLTEEDIDNELSREERKQEERGKEELFEASVRAIETESQEPLERLLEGLAEPKEIEELIEKSSQEFREYDKPMEEYGLREELRENFELQGEEFVGHERVMEEFEKEEGLIEELAEEVGEYGELEGEIVEYERPEEKLEEVIEGFEEYERELEAPREFEEVGELIEEAVEEVVEETGEEEVGEEGVEEEALEERGEVTEEVKEGELVGEEVGEEVAEETEESEASKKGVEEEVREEAREQGVEGGGEGGGEPPEAVAAGEEGRPEKEFELEDFTAGEEKLSLRGKRLKQGFHWARAVRDDGKVVEWTINVKREASKIRVPKDLKGKRVKELAIYKYDRDRYFPRSFEILGHSLYFDPGAKKLILDGKEIGIEKIEWELEKLSKRKEHGPFVTVTTSLKSIKAHGGHQLQLRLYQDGTVNIRDPSGQTRAIRKMGIEGNLLRLRYYRYEPEFPLYAKELKDRVKYDIRANVKGRTVICFVEKFKEKFGQDSVKEMQDRIAKDEAALVAYFDKGKSCCRNKELVISIPKRSETLEQIEVLPTEFLLKQKAADLLSDYKDKVAEGNVGELLTKDEYGETILEEASKLIGVPKKELEMEGPNKMGPDYLIKDKNTEEVLIILDVKSTIKPDEFDSPMTDKMLDRAVNKLMGYMKEEKYKSAKIALIARDYYDPWEALRTGGGIKKFRLIKMSRDGEMETIFEDEEDE
ncbi:MAG: hypothetical protein QXW09_05485 [Thermoproteota archaeon]